MRRNLSILLILGGALVLLAGLAGGQAPAQKQMFMEISLIATGKDNVPVQDLKQEDLEVKDNNKKQEIILFEKVDGAAAPTPGKPGLHNIVLLDCLDTTFSDLPENRLEMLKILNEFSKASNVTFLMLRQQLQVLSDPASSEGLLPRFAKQGFDPSAKLDAYNWVFSDGLGMTQMFTPAGVLERVRIQNALGALKTIAQNYQGRSGRKNLFWITRGVPLTAGEAGAGYNEQRVMLDSKGNPQSAIKADDDLSVFAKDMDITNRMLNNSAIAVYTIDAKNMAVDNMKTSDQASMTDMSKVTGGVAYLSRRDIAGAVREAINDSRFSYVLRYNISDLKYDGKLHRIKIDTKRKDVKIRAREGYYAPSVK